MILENLKVKPIELETGRNIVVLNENDVKELGLYAGDRVKLVISKTTLTAIVDVTDRMVQPGEIGTFAEVTRALDLHAGDTVNLASAPSPQPAHPPALCAWATSPPSPRRRRPQTAPAAPTASQR